jgi:phytoene desaturase
VPNLKTANIDWSVEGPKYRDKILAYLEKHYIPGLTADMVTSRFITPDDFVTDLNAWKGAAFSLEPILTQSAFFRTHNRDDVIPNLYFVGAGTHPGAGIPGVVGSAKATAGLMIDDYLIDAARHERPGGSRAARRSRRAARASPPPPPCSTPRPGPTPRCCTPGAATATT